MMKALNEGQVEAPALVKVVEAAVVMVMMEEGVEKVGEAMKAMVGV